MAYNRSRVQHSFIFYHYTRLPRSYFRGFVAYPKHSKYLPAFDDNGDIEKTAVIAVTGSRADTQPTAVYIRSPSAGPAFERPKSIARQAACTYEFVASSAHDAGPFDWKSPSETRVAASASLSIPRIGAQHHHDENAALAPMQRV